MDILQKVDDLAKRHNEVSPEFIQARDVRPGLRNPDGSGVIAGVTTKGRVYGYDKVREPDGSFRKVPLHGRLFYCGYDAIALAQAIQAEGRFGFDQIVWLLLSGDQPRRRELEEFEQLLASRRDLSRAERGILLQESGNHNQMYALHSVVSHLGRLDPKADDTSSLNLVEQCVNLIAKFPTIIAHNFKFSMYGRGSSLNLVSPDPNLGTAENFLYMLRGELPTPDEAMLFDLSLMLHAENGGGNNSTFVVRTVSSAGSNTYMAICAGIASLSGPLHGGANEAVMRMLDDLRTQVHDWNDEDEIRTYLERLLDRKAFDGQGKIYGMGHAVYTLSDPRTELLRTKAKEVAATHGRSDEFAFFDKVSRLGCQLVEEKRGQPTCVNIDFFSGFIHDMLGIPLDLYTPLFAMARVAGWSAHRIEQVHQNRLIRPGYVNSLEGERFYKGLD